MLSFFFFVIPKKQMRPKCLRPQFLADAFAIEWSAASMSILKNGEGAASRGRRDATVCECDLRAAAETFPLRSEILLLCFTWEKGPACDWRDRRYGAGLPRDDERLLRYRRCSFRLSRTLLMPPRNNPRSQIDSLLSFIDASTMHTIATKIYRLLSHNLLRQLTIRIGNLKLVVQLAFFFVDGKCTSPIYRW